MSSWFGGAVNGNANAFEFRIVEGVTFAVFPIHSNTGVRVDWGDGNIEYFGPVTGQESKPTAYSLGSVGWIDHNYTGNTFSKILKIDGDLNGIYPGGARFFQNSVYEQNFATPGIADKIVSYGTVPLNRPSKEYYLDYNQFGFWLTGIFLDVGMFAETWETGDFSSATKITTWNLDLPTDSQPDFRGTTLATALFGSTSIGTTGAIDHWVMPFNTVTANNFESWFGRVVAIQDPVTSTDGAIRYPFNTNISRWFAKGCPQDCTAMFYYTPVFNQDLSAWNMSNATSMASMFNVADSFNQDIGSWDVSNVTNFSNMFSSASAFNNGGSTSIGSWNTSSATNMFRMFEASAFNQPIGSWDVSNVTTMSEMFDEASAFNQDIGSWNVSNVGTFNAMFRNATAFNQDIGSWDVSGSSLFSSMFDSATSFNQDLSSWNTSLATNMSYMFNNNTTFNNGGATGIGNWDVSNVTTFDFMFYNADSFNQPLLDWDCSSGNFFREMFRGNNGFGITNASGEGTNPLNWTLKTIGTSSTIDMRGMFWSSWFNSDISGWDVSGIRDIERFAQSSRFNNGNTQGIYGDIDTWTWDNCFDFRVSFYGSQFNQPIGNWTFTTSRTILASDMFAFGRLNQDISNWDVSLFSTFQRAFNGSEFNQDLGPWGDHLYSSVALANMLDNCDMSTENYSRTLIGFANYVFDNSGPFSRNLGAASLTYHGSTGTTYGGYGSEQFVDAVNARAYLTGTGGWTITDGGSV